MTNKKDNSELVAILAYVIVGVIWYFADDTVHNPYVKFHVKQAINLFVVSVVVQMVLSMVILVGWLIMPLVGLAIFVLWLIGIINAMNGKKKYVPVIGKFAGKYLTF